eukprot:SAG11_NODE_22981_length_397_cov_0.694631_1_plen_72_part_01
MFRVNGFAFRLLCDLPIAGASTEQKLFQDLGFRRMRICKTVAAKPVPKSFRFEVGVRICGDAKQFARVYGTD